MSRFFIAFLVIIISHTIEAQSWQWGKRGGSTDVLETTNDFRQEEVYSIVTDSNKNIYVLSSVGKNGLDIDGVIKTNYGSTTQITDIALSSFACDGTYRWSKIIGGNSYDRVNKLQIDNEDNIYISGKFGSCGNVTYPPRIEDDVLLPQNPIDCSVVFLAKYNSNGVLQWFKRPQPAGTSSSVGLSDTFSPGLASDGFGNSYWLLLLPSGTYVEGAFVNTMPGRNYFIFKYDSLGNFISSTHIDMQLSNGSYLQALEFFRNPYNGYFYFTSRKGSGNAESAIVGGQTITHTVFLSCFNDLGQFQWVREDTATTPGSLFLYNLAFDSANDIYLGGRLVGLNFNNFLGLIIPETIAPGFIMKVNPTATTLLWSSYNNGDALQRGAIVLNNNELAFTSHCAGTTFTWGTQTLNASGTNQGTEVLLARFNKDTGACIQLTKIPGNVGYNDAGTALAVDSSGDYILGGGTGGQLTFTTNTTNTIGPQSDFFVAKYSTSTCSLGTEDFIDEGLQIFPNPANSYFAITTSEKLNYSIYNITGSLLKTGTIFETSNTINVSDLSSGCYLVTTINDSGVLKRGKLVKN